MACPIPLLSVPKARSTPLCKSAFMPKISFALRPSNIPEATSACGSRKWALWGHSKPARPGPPPAKVVHRCKQPTRAAAMSCSATARSASSADRWRCKPFMIWPTATTGIRLASSKPTPSPLENSGVVCSLVLAAGMASQDSNIAPTVWRCFLCARRLCHPKRSLSLIFAAVTWRNGSTR